MSYSFPVNILHLATGKNGGARLAAEQLAMIQRNYGDTVGIIPSSESKTRKILGAQAFKSKISTLAQKVITTPGYGLVSTMSVSSISKSKVQSENLDLIHIHNWFNLINLHDVHILAKKVPLVFTLHDQRLGTGGCHYTFECQNYLNGCKNCPAVKFGKTYVARSKVKVDKIFSEIKNYGIIAPSSWIISGLENQPVLQYAKSIAVIPNITEFGIQKNRKNTNRIFREKFELLFVASDINQPVKGLLLLIKCLNNISHLYPKLHLNIVGWGNSLAKINFSHRYHGFMNKDSLIDLMRKSNICIVPSLMDNLPSVIIEALRNECIVLSTNVGGIGEVIIDGQNGFLTDPNQARMESKIMEVLNLSQIDQNKIRKNALKFINRNYNNEKIYAQHKKLYLDVLNHDL